MDDFTGGMIVSGIIGAAISTCVWITTDVSVQMDSFQHGQKLCEANGGLASIYEDKTRWGSIVCNNKATFEYDTRVIRSEEKEGS